MSDLPQGWARTKLGNTISLNYGKSLPATVRDGGKFAVFGSNGIVGRHSEAITAAPAIVVGRKGSFGEVHFSEEACFPIDTTYYVDTFTTLDARFAFHLLRHLPLTQMNRASAIPGLNREDAYGLDVELPPLPEQRQIVAKVDGLATRIARARKELDRFPTLIACYKKRLLAQAFSGELTAGWRAKNANVGQYTVRSALPQYTDESERGVWEREALPASWGWVPFGSAFIDVTDSKRKIQTKEYSEEGRFPVIDQGMAQIAGYTDREDMVQLAKPPYVVFGDHTRCVKLVRSRFVQGADGVKVLNPTAAFDAAYLYFALQYVQLPDKGYSRHMKFLRATHFPQCSLAEQAEIVHRIESCFGWLDRVAADHTAADRLLHKLHAAILAKAFAGNLVPQDPEDEPASVLLERIRAEREAAPKVKRGKQVRKIGPTKDLKIMAKNLEQVLADAGDWMPAQDAFKKCGIGGAATTEEIEKIYAELRKLDKAGRIEAEPVNDDQGRKLHDRLRLKVA